MDSNVRSIQPPRLLDVRAARGKRERPRRDSSGKEFELDEAEEQAPRPAAGTTSPPQGTVSTRQEDEAGARLDLTA